MGVVEELASSPIAPLCRNIMIGSTRPGPDHFSFPVYRSANKERKRTKKFLWFSSQIFLQSIDVASSSVSGSVVFPPFLSLSLKDVDVSLI